MAGEGWAIILMGHNFYFVAIGVEEEGFVVAVAGAAGAVEVGDAGLVEGVGEGVNGRFVPHD